jgi:hypothetical protein
VFLIVSLRTEKIIPYEVREGSLVMNYTYRALALREEEIVNSDKSGYISYFAREGERVAPGNLVFIVDETGDLKEYLENESIDNAKSYLEVQNIISPSSPNPDNYKNFENYTSVYEKEITLADNSKATALIFETDNVRETYAEIYKDGILISIRANKEKLTDEFFRSFDVAEMN